MLPTLGTGYPSRYGRRYGPGALVTGAPGPSFGFDLLVHVP